MLDATSSAQLKSLLENVKLPIELVASLDDSPKSAEMWALLEDTATVSPLVTARRDDAAANDGRRPSFTIARVGTDISVRFAGIPMGHEFPSYILALLQVGGHPARISDELAEQIRNLDVDLKFETYFSLTCQNCPDVVQALNLMSVLNPRIKHIGIEGSLYQEEIAQRDVLAVPTVYVNGELFGQGRMSVEEIVGKLDTGALARHAEDMSAKEPYDVLVVGGGPAGAAAAIYAARKGIRTGIAAERLGGQVLDTMTIENLISVRHTEGPQLASALEAHINDYEVDVMKLQRAVELIPAEGPDDLHSVRFENGATLQARTIVITTGARWRNMNVPGEQEYRNKGVTYCPHCDGPLFKGKKVAVIGGGNSGVEAAIDLAGVVGHVTLIEFDDELRADEVLQRKLRSLPNADVIVSALTTEVEGAEGKVSALKYSDRTNGAVQTVNLEGVFVQIGLLPNTEWVKGVLDLSSRGEINIDERGATSIPGIFAAGDCTTVPFKQIVISMGAGATAALSAFDHLIRTSAPLEAVGV